jgi:hypothetical protein
MARRGRSSKTWKATISGPRSNIVASATHSSSSCVRTILLACSLENPSVERYDGKICHPWGRKCVSLMHRISPGLIGLRKASRYIAGSFFNDTTGMFRTRLNENAPAANGDAQPATATLQAAMTAGQKTQWLMLCRPQGVVEVCTYHVIPSILFAFLLLPYP